MLLYNNLIWYSKVEFTRCWKKYGGANLIKRLMLALLTSLLKDNTSYFVTWLLTHMRFSQIEIHEKTIVNPQRFEQPNQKPWKTIVCSQRF